jgi:hypothetical protein
MLSAIYLEYLVSYLNHRTVGPQRQRNQTHALPCKYHRDKFGASLSVGECPITVIGVSEAHWVIYDYKLDDARLIFYTHSTLHTTVYLEQRVPPYESGNTYAA